MAQETERKVVRRELLTKKPFYRINADVGQKSDFPRNDIGEQRIVGDKLNYDIVTQEDFLRELDPNSHAINDKGIYQTWMQSDENGLYYETEWERHAFAFQQEILEDRLVRLTGNDIQFDLSDRTEKDDIRQDFYKFKTAWAEKSMERAWYEVAKSVLATGDAAFIGIIDKGKFYWKVLTFLKGDVLYPHYDRKTGRMSVFARQYTDYNDNGEIRKYVDVWNDKYYYRFVENIDSEGDPNTEAETEKINYVGDFSLDGYVLDETPQLHGFDEIPVAYRRCDSGPCWSCSQETIEHYELAFSRLAQSNSAFGLPILSITQGTGRKVEELTMGDMTYAAKIFLVPSDGKAEFLQRQDASNAYKAQLDELKRKIYEQSMVVKAPELKSGDTPAAAIKLLYSDSYNKAMNETQEFDEVIDKMVDIFSWGAGIEYETRLRFINLPLSHFCIPFIPISEGELATILATGVQNGFCSKQTASEKFPYATPQEWSRLMAEKHDEQMNDLLLQEQKLDIQYDHQIDFVEAQAEINADQQIQISEAQAKISDGGSSDKKTAHKVVIKKGSGSGGKRGRPNMTGAQWDSNNNKINPMTGKAYSHWDGDGKS